MPVMKSKVLRAADVQKALEELGKITNNLRAVFKWVPSETILARYDKRRATPPAQTERGVKAGFYIGPWPLFIGDCHEVDLNPGDIRRDSEVPAALRRKTKSRGGR